jgi:hypothetical protein
MFQGDVSSTFHIYMFHMLHRYVPYVSLVRYICSMLIYEQMMLRLMQCKCKNASLTPRVLYTYTSCSQFDADYYISACLWVTLFFQSEVL